jgi:hypothetical protein
MPQITQIEQMNADVISVHLLNPRYLRPLPP